MDALTEFNELIDNFTVFSGIFVHAEGDLVVAVVPFMGESISDGTLATFLKSMLPPFP